MSIGKAPVSCPTLDRKDAAIYLGIFKSKR